MDKTKHDDQHPDECAPDPDRDEMALDPRAHERADQRFMSKLAVGMHLALINTRVLPDEIIERAEAQDMGPFFMGYEPDPLTIWTLGRVLAGDPTVMSEFTLRELARVEAALDFDVLSVVPYCQPYPRRRRPELTSEGPDKQAAPPDADETE